MLARVLCAAALWLPRRAPRAVDADEGPHHLWFWIEDNGAFVFPLLGLAVVALVVWALRRGAQSSEAELQNRRAQKDAIVRLMRSRFMLNADTVAAELNVDRFHAAALLEELQREGTLIQNKVAGGVATYRLKGL